MKDMVVDIKKKLRRKSLYFRLLVLLIICAMFIIFLSELKNYYTNREVDKVVTDLYDVINNEMFNDKLIEEKKNEVSENEINYNEDISGFKKRLMKQGKISEAYFMTAYENVIYEKYDDAQENLKKSLDNMKKSTTTMTKIYSGILLAKKYVLIGDENSACRTVETSLSYLNRKDYNKYYKEICMLMNTVTDTECGNKVVLAKCEEIINEYKGLDKKAELYLLMRMKDMYIKNNNYAKVSECIIKSCYIAYDLQDNYMLAKSFTDLGILSKSIENREKAIDIINQALEINIENDYERAYMNVYENINLAEIYCELDRYKEAEMCINRIASDIKIINGNNYTEYEIRRLIVLSQISLNEGDIDIGKKYLDKSYEIIQNSAGIQNKEINMNYSIAYGRYFESTGRLKEALNHYSDLIKICVENNDLYNERKTIKRIINITMSNKESVLDERYIDEIADIIRNDDDIVYSDYSHYIYESVKSEIIIAKQKERYKFIFKVLFLSITLSVHVFIILSRKMRKLKIQNQKDGLTKAYNRLYFNDCYEKCMKNSWEFSVMMIDVDNFKKLNDTFGHNFGDTVLIRICREISHMLDKNMKLFRYGGEEFVVLRMDDSTEVLRKKAEAIRQHVEKMKWDEDVSVTLSIGIADSLQDKENTLKRADQNLYKAKTTGRNKVVG